MYNLSHLKNYLEQKFHIQNKLFWIITVFFLVLRLFWAAYFPMTNDEVYYWDWSRHLQLSYIDAPPLVAWCAYLGGLFFKGAFGARFTLPFIHILSCLFLVGSSKLICRYEGVPLKNKHIFYLLLLTETVPAFSLEGILLLPDGPLLFGISGALFFLLKSVTAPLPANPSFPRYLQGATGESRRNLPLFYAIPFGIFLGISALAKYHAFPIAVGFFLATVAFRGIKSLPKDILFWLVVIVTSAFIASPVFIWNIQNHWASFQFQGQHGFADMSFSVKPFFRYCLGMIFYIWPWFFFAFLYYAYKNCKLKSLHIFTILPFLILFFLILFSALGKQALPHWALPGFYLLIPSFVLWLHSSRLVQELNENRIRSTKKNKIFIIISIVFVVTLPTLACVDKFNQFIINSFVYFTGNADPLAQVFQWNNLQEELQKNKTITVNSQVYSPQISPCRKPYEIASLRWYWTAQMAFYFKNQPRVYNFDFSNSSFYSWRDSLTELAGCSILVIGSKNHFNKEQLEEVMNIENIEIFSLAPYTGNNIVVIKGVMKDSSILEKFDKNGKENIRY